MGKRTTGATEQQIEDAIKRIDSDRGTHNENETFKKWVTRAYAGYLIPPDMVIAPRNLVERTVAGIDVAEWDIPTITDADLAEWRELLK